MKELLTKEQVIKDWKITDQNIADWFSEVGESLNDIASLSGLSVDWEDDFPGIYVEKQTSLKPHDNLILFSMVKNNMFIEELKEHLETTEWAHVGKYGLSWLQEPGEYLTGGYEDMTHFIEEEGSGHRGEYSEEQFSDFTVVLAEAINNSNQIKVNWYIVLKHYELI